MARHSDHHGPKLTRRSRKPFSHSLLRAPGVRALRKRPHQPERWKPATFDHDKLFVLDRDHNTKCATCHTNDDYSRYTCYGCHEHRPEKVRAEHQEEGIRDFENCVECHLSANQEPKRTGSGERRKRD